MREQEKVTKPHLAAMCSRETSSIFQADRGLSWLDQIVHKRGPRVGELSKCAIKYADGFDRGKQRTPGCSFEDAKEDAFSKLCSGSRCR